MTEAEEALTAALIDGPALNESLEPLGLDRTRHDLDRPVTRSSRPAIERKQRLLKPWSLDRVRPRTITFLAESASAPRGLASPDDLWARAVSRCLRPLTLARADGRAPATTDPGRLSRHRRHPRRLHEFGQAGRPRPHR